MDRRFGQHFTVLAGLAVGAVACGATPDAARAPRGAGSETHAIAVSANSLSTKPSMPGRCARARAGNAFWPLSRQGGVVALAAWEGSTLAYVADEDDDAIHTMDADADAPRELAVTPLDGMPSQIVVLADGRVAVALRDKNRIAIYEPGATAADPLELRCETAVSAEPVGLATTPDGAAIAVVTGWGRRLTLLEGGALTTVFEAPLPRAPRSVIVDDDGKRAFVSHLVGGSVSVVDLVDAGHAARAIDVRVDEVAARRGAKLRSSDQGFALAATSEAGKLTRVFAPVVSVNSGPLAPTSTYGGANAWGPPPVAPSVAVLDARTERPFEQTLATAGSRTEPCVLPRAAAMFGQGELLVACLGIDALVDLDARGHDPARVERRRWRLPAGPTGLAVDEVHARAVVWSQFARELSVVDLAPGATHVARASAARRRDGRMTPVLARGRALFHATGDTRISADGRACASCHVDGREDGLTWSTPMGPRQTIMLAGRVTDTGPYGWYGASATLKQHITHTIHRLGGQGMGDGDRADFDALIGYVRSIRGPSLEGAVVDPAKAALAARGREIFYGERQGCAGCHVGGGTDGQPHDVGSGDVNEASLRFDTPSLRFIGGTAPYFHDGRYSSLVDLLEKSEGSMGHTLHLGAQDSLALAAYLETL